jgi:hypothetical protein
MQSAPVNIGTIDSFGASHVTAGEISGPQQQRSGFPSSGTPSSSGSQMAGSQVRIFLLVCSVNLQRHVPPEV